MTGANFFPQLGFFELCSFVVCWDVSSGSQAAEADFKVGTPFKTFKEVDGCTAPLKDFAGTGPC